MKPLDLHKKLKGKTVISSKEKLSKDNLHLLYTPGVGEASLEIAADKNKVDVLTGRKNTVAIVTDGTAVLGLGDIGPEAALPVMEGKAAIFADFAGINAVPLCLATKKPEEIIQIVKNIAPAFGGINLEDIAAPQCFEIEERLNSELNIPVFHDDQHGTAIVVLAGLINSLKLANKGKDVKIVISGAGAAGIAIANLLSAYGLNNYCLCDSKGTICDTRNDLNGYKKAAIRNSLAKCDCGPCEDSLRGADVLIGVSMPNQFTAADIKRMNPNPIVFALANPIPEIMPEEAKKGGAYIVATGRSDFPNQINNALVFPGLFRGMLDSSTETVTDEIKIIVAETIAKIVKKPTVNNIVPSIFEAGLVEAIARAVKRIS